MKQITSLPLLFIFSLLVLTTCKKTEVIEQEIHMTNFVDTVSVIPPYDGVNTTIVENYVNKLYIDLIGREPTTAELKADAATLKNNDLDQDSRETVISGVISSSEYYNRFFEIASDNMLNGIDSITMEQDGIGLLEVIKNMALLNGDTATADLADIEILKLRAVLDATGEYRKGLITINEYHRRFVFNYAYDQINMGSENFIVSCFENLLYRLPTDDETSNGVTMVDGAPAFIFLQEGQSKEDFVSIITQVDDFYEGLVVGVYLNLLLRKPTSIEMADATEELLNSTSTYQELQKELTKTQEYAGF